MCRKSVKIFVKYLKIWANWKYGKKWRPALRDLKKRRPTLAEKHEDHFLDVIPKKCWWSLWEKLLWLLSGENYCHKNFAAKFGEIRVKILRTPKNLPAPAQSRRHGELWWAYPPQTEIRNTMSWWNFCHIWTSNFLAAVLLLTCVPADAPDLSSFETTSAPELFIITTLRRLHCKGARRPLAS